MTSSDYWQSSCSTMQAAIQKLWETKEFSDVVFIVGKTKTQVHGHKFILMARSPVFASTFGNRWEPKTVKEEEVETKCERSETEKKGEIAIPEVSDTSFQLFLEYLYTDKFCVTEEDALDVLYLADHYICDSLKELCSNLLKYSMAIDDVIAVHQSADKMNLVDLRNQSLEFILRNGNSVFQDAGFLKIESKTLSTILKDDNLVINELTAFQAVVRWAVHRCVVHELDNTVEHKRSLLKHILPYIRFPIMGQNDFSEEVVKMNKGILTDWEIVQVQMYMAYFQNRPWSAFPFNVNKRCHPDYITYTVEPYNGQGSYFEDSSCRQMSGLIGGTGSRHECVSTLMFSSSQTIYMNRIQLHGFRDPNTILGLMASSAGTLRVHDISDFARNSCLIVSIKAMKGSHMTSCEVTPEQLITLTSSSSGLIIEFGNVITIMKNDEYEIKVTYKGGAVCLGLLQSRQGEHTSSADVICGNTKITLSFDSEETRCGIQRPLGHKAAGCISSGQIKTMYFTL